MNIIFVDIDGPLLPQKMHLFEQNHKGGIENPPIFDPMAVRIFNIWAKYGNAKIVFSTNWAANFDDDELKLIMEVNGLGFDYHEHVTTPKRMRSDRHDEIINWLAMHSKKGDKFIAVDDDTKCQYIEPIINEQRTEVDATGKWIQVSFENGISWDNYVDGCEVLGIDRDIVNWKEFGIKILTQEEKDKQVAALSLFV